MTPPTLNDIGFPKISPSPPNVPSFQPQNSTSVLVHLFFFLVFETALRLKLGGGGILIWREVLGTMSAVLDLQTFHLISSSPPFLTHPSFSLSLFILIFFSLFSRFFSRNISWRFSFSLSPSHFSRIYLRHLWRNITSYVLHLFFSLFLSIHLFFFLSLLLTSSLSNLTANIMKHCLFCEGYPCL